VDRQARLKRELRVVACQSWLLYEWMSDVRLREEIPLGDQLEGVNGVSAKSLFGGSSVDGLCGRLLGPKAQHGPGPPRSSGSARLWLIQDLRW
jgi:hypothetical protein